MTGLEAGTTYDLIAPGLREDIENANSISRLEGIINGIPENMALCPGQRTYYLSMAERKRVELVLRKANGNRYHGK